MRVHSRSVSIEPINTEFRGFFPVYAGNILARVCSPEQSEVNMTFCVKKQFDDINSSNVPESAHSRIARHYLVHRTVS